jgi:hypothetical protein
MAGCEYSSSEQLHKQSGKVLQQLLEYSVVSNCKTSRSKALVMDQCGRQHSTIGSTEACVRLTGNSETGYRPTTEEKPLFFNRRVRVERVSMLLRGQRFTSAAAASGGTDELLQPRG